MTKMSDTEALEPSVAVTLTLMEPTLPLSGVPEKVRVKVLKLSQEGKGSALASVAVKVSVSPTSRSAKLLAGTWKENTASSGAFWSTMGLATVGNALDVPSLL